MSPAVSTYLNDHHAGARAALTLLERLEESYPAHRPFITSLKEEIAADREVLADILQRLQITESVTRQVSGWVGAKALALKLAVDQPNESFALLESLEGLSLGILGKHKLWVGLAAVTARFPPLADIDFGRLQQRALEQHDRVEAARVEALRLSLVADA